MITRLCNASAHAAQIGLKRMFIELSTHSKFWASKHLARPAFLLGGVDKPNA
jgi:hypothetical protein